MKSFKKGQKVWSVRGGWATVVRVDELVLLDDCQTYSLDGKWMVDDLRPTLFHDEPKDWPNPDQPCKFEVDQPLLVRDGDPLNWQLAYFCRMSSTGTGVYCWKDGKKSHELIEVAYWAEYKTLDEVLGE